MTFLLWLLKVSVSFCAILIGVGLAYWLERRNCQRLGLYQQDDAGEWKRVGDLPK